MHFIKADYQSTSKYFLDNSILNIWREDCKLDYFKTFYLSEWKYIIGGYAHSPNFSIPSQLINFRLIRIIYLKTEFFKFLGNLALSIDLKMIHTVYHQFGNFNFNRTKNQYLQLP